MPQAKAWCTRARQRRRPTRTSSQVLVVGYRKRSYNSSICGQSTVCHSLCHSKAKLFGSTASVGEQGGATTPGVATIAAGGTVAKRTAFAIALEVVFVPMTSSLGLAGYVGVVAKKRAGGTSSSRREIEGRQQHIVLARPRHRRGRRRDEKTVKAAN